jgi:hypothetical protein
MGEEATRHYELCKSDASWLAGAVLMPPDIRQKVFEKYAEENGQARLVNLFVQFVGMANSVVENGRAFLEEVAIIHGDMHPYQAEKLNLPTIYGACRGAEMAHGITQDALCGGCAFRIGTHANQSPTTTCDADACAHPYEQPFMCHEDLDEGGNPTKGCAGAAQLRAVRKTRAGRLLDGRTHDEMPVGRGGAA